tara:strand:+ start:1935 stop:2048 length:114 start_codon:yes stop_codon:yes gene_type:complete
VSGAIPREASARGAAKQPRRCAAGPYGPGPSQAARVR